MNRLLPEDLSSGDLFVRYLLRGDRGPEERSGRLLPDGLLLSGDGSRHRADEVTWLPPVRPGKIVAVGLNDRGHALEMGKPLPAEPLLFLKAHCALAASGESVVYPAVSARVDFEGEIALVIGERADHVSPSESGRHLFGICAANDITARDLQTRDVQYTRAKSFPGFCPLGPAILVGGRPDGRRVRTWLNGVLKQDGSEAGQIFRWESLISYISHMMPLETGDLVLTGTYRGIGPMAVGDTVTVSVEGCGPPLESRIVADPRPALSTVWPGQTR